MSRLFLYSLIVLFLFGNVSYADVASLSPNYVAGQTDVVTKLNDDRTKLVNSVNNIRGVYAGSVQTSGQIKADTVGEENMADDANPRIRTADGASCTDFVTSGLLPTTSTSLVGNISSGVAYPDGYRTEKTSSTAKTFTASKWTYGYILTSGSFDYQEVAINGAQPSDLPNSAVLFRVSTDATTIVSVTDLRKTSCTAGPFSSISDKSSEATLNDLFSEGTFVRRAIQGKPNPQGIATGSMISYNDTTTFVVTPGCLYIKGYYRCVSVDTTVPNSADDPAAGVSGRDTGNLAASTKYYVFGVADQTSVKTYSVTYSTSATAPTGLSNYRLIGMIRTDADTKFVSYDTVTIHAINDQELVKGWINFDGTGNTKIRHAYNVSGLTDLGTGSYTVTWDYPFARASGYSVVGTCSATTGNYRMFETIALTATTTQVETGNTAAGAEDETYITMIAIGDSQ